MSQFDSENRGAEFFEELDPEPRLLMGPGPVDVYPRVLRAMSVPLQGQFDPQFTGYMNQVMALYRGVFCTKNHWTLLINGTARAGIEACLASVLAPGDRMLVPVFGRFGHLKMEIGWRLGAEVVAIDTEWGKIFEPDAIEAAIRQHRPKWSRSVTATPPPPCCSRWPRSARSAASTTYCSMSTPPPRSAATRSRWTTGRSTSRRPACRNACRDRPARRR